MSDVSVTGALHSAVVVQALKSTVGENVAVFIDGKNQRVRRVYGENQICAGGLPPRDNSATRQREFYQTEKRAYLQLQSLNSPYVARNVVFDDNSQAMTMPYLGPDLFVRAQQEGWQPHARHLRQLVEMYHEYRLVKFFKFNSGRPNLYLDEKQDRLIAADFKWCTPRDLYCLTHELHMIHRDLSALDPQMPRMLQVTFSDFPADILQVAYTWLEENPLQNRHSEPEGLRRVYNLRVYLQDRFGVKILRDT